MIDASLYPDMPAPERFSSDSQRADYVQRVCAAWDFGLPPDAPTVDLFSKWQQVFDAYPLPHSSAFHAFRATYGWIPMEGDVMEADYERYDRQEGRSTDVRI